MASDAQPSDAIGLQSFPSFSHFGMLGTRGPPPSEFRKMGRRRAACSDSLRKSVFCLDNAGQTHSCDVSLTFNLSESGLESDLNMIIYPIKYAFSNHKLAKELVLFFFHLG